MLVISDDIVQALPEMRAQAESLMCDTVRIELRGEVSVDPVTLQDIPVSWNVLYEGKARIQRRVSESRTAVAGDLTVAVDAIEVQLPWTAPNIPRRAEVEVLAVSPLSSAEVGMRLWVREDESKTHATKRTLACEAVSDDSPR